MIDGNKSRAIKEAKWVGGSTVLLSSRILMCDAFVWQDRVKNSNFLTLHYLTYERNNHKACLQENAKQANMTLNLISTFKCLVPKTHGKLSQTKTKNFTKDN
ncbi:hypothetical protein ERO13_A09G247301v2 [Gossypium hirsutum]|uniref:Uncharacterized protein n=2 Tax=Gossypium TaxID=3633 RepID=A0A5D2Y327_GOSMU|nr:hypothetical protein ERO13_A09G247301v2 [Gossypium hirsutum]TYH04330.1 hypothetical protein ES288_A09G289800v1 [Gossypium darwinii]TYJ20486.1 hypothetical protein E1A91_A09G268300v1 [Gossypium mustelinum]